MQSCLLVQLVAVATLAISVLTTPHEVASGTSSPFPPEHIHSSLEAFDENEYVEEVTITFDSYKCARGDRMSIESFDSYKCARGDRMSIESYPIKIRQTKYRAWKRNADLINSLLALPKGMNEAGRKR